MSAPHGHLEIEDDVFAYAADGCVAAVFDGGGDFRARRLERLRLLAEPDGFDDVAGDAGGESAGDGFDFGEFGHEA